MSAGLASDGDVRDEPVPGTSRAVVVLALLGIVASAFAFLPYVDGGDVCGAFGGSCAAASSTIYGHSFGVPAPILSAVYFATSLAVATAAAEGASTAWRALFVLCASGAAVSLWLLGVTFVRLQMICPACLLVHGVSLLLTTSVARATWREEPSWLRAMVPRLMAVLALAVGAMAAWFMLRVPLAIHSQPSHTLAHPLWVWHGRRDVISVIIDPGCPACARHWLALEAEYDVRVALYPVDQPCLELARAIAPELPVPSPERHHLGACRLSAWIYCAGQQDLAGPMLAVATREINERGAHVVGRWDAARYVELGRAAGLDLEHALACTGESERPWAPQSMPPRTRRAFARHIASAGRVLAGRPVPFLFR